ncbi:4,5-DOPA dioxygenase extradiol [Bdellovibrio bacteriovorus]|uniref:4,5-DOPA-extradiol-dioxygenase n=2 Tax=Bdellovibrio bacteriovorus TaxID=959 RepID=UPI00045BE57A|nr:4,5-DOPA dioxygenase extradiol [Bdellovibrio bacteriovorus]AHZ86253.1 dioxygenase [Bdellovibrio bacteriovorus]BEV67490.1 4,5-DOPA dioxygenase extradiol [Bdellovibrio bacteriovorus]
MSVMPVLFIGHGSPMNALDKNAFTETLNKLGKSLPKPQAVLSVSAHWETEGTKVLYHPDPPTIHDFYGFPKALFDMQYPARGPLSIAHETQRLLPKSELYDKWGLDHGTWSVLAHLYPHADIPTYQVSLDVTKTNQQHLELGKLLRPLRDKGVLIVASGNIVHNLSLIQWKNKDGSFPWAEEFDGQIKAALEARDTKTLTDHEALGESAALSVPTPEHYLPLLYAFGASTEEDRISYPYEGFEMGSLSMRAVMWSR